MLNQVVRVVHMVTTSLEISVVLLTLQKHAFIRSEWTLESWCYGESDGTRLGRGTAFQYNTFQFLGSHVWWWVCCLKCVYCRCKVLPVPQFLFAKMRPWRKITHRSDDDDDDIRHARNGFAFQYRSLFSWVEILLTLESSRSLSVTIFPRHCDISERTLQYCGYRQVCSSWRMRNGSEFFRSS